MKAQPVGINATPTPDEPYLVSLTARQLEAVKALAQWAVRRVRNGKTHGYTPDFTISAEHDCYVEFDENASIHIVLTKRGRKLRR